MFKHGINPSLTHLYQWHYLLSCSFLSHQSPIHFTAIFFHTFEPLLSLSTSLPSSHFPSLKSTYALRTLSLSLPLSLPHMNYRAVIALTLFSRRLSLSSSLLSSFLSCDLSLLPLRSLLLSPSSLCLLLRSSRSSSFFCNIRERF